MAAEYKEQEEKMQKTLDNLQENYATLRAGRANASVLNKISVDYYGVATPLNQVASIASPEPHEKARHYLWRFWTRLPRSGHFAIFDRTWYGRVMVERIEGFCEENDWQRAYNEINEFEEELHDWGAVILKFWIHIDAETQLERFNARQNTPEKQWKITEEDWRNREKWPQYEEAVTDMLQKTSTEYAPWYIIESNDKLYARIKVLRIVADAMEKAAGKGKA